MGISSSVWSINSLKNNDSFLSRRAISMIYFWRSSTFLCSSAKVLLHWISWLEMHGGRRPWIPRICRSSRVNAVPYNKNKLPNNLLKFFTKLLLQPFCEIQAACVTHKRFSLKLNYLVLPTQSPKGVKQQEVGVGWWTQQRFICASLCCVQAPTPYLSMYHFWQKRYPLHIPSTEKW